MSNKTRTLIAAIDFMYGTELKNAESEFVAAVEDVESLVSRGLAYVKGHEPLPTNSGMPDPINPAKEARRQALVKAHIDDASNADDESRVDSPVDLSADSPATPTDPPADPPIDPPVDPPVDPPADPPVTPEQ